MSKLNVNVGDVVKVIYPQQEELSYVAIVEKVLPNGRFKTERCEEYWRADGTKNTHAKKWEKDQYVVNGTLNDYELKHRELIAHRLRLIANTIERTCIGGQTGYLHTFSKILTAIGFDGDEQINQVERKMHEKKLTNALFQNKIVLTDKFPKEMIDMVENLKDI